MLFIKCSNNAENEAAFAQNASSDFAEANPCPDGSVSSEASTPNIASRFTDEHGDPTDVAGYIAAIEWVEKGIAKYGESA